METIQQRIVRKCLDKMTESDEVDASMIHQLRQVLLRDKKLKVEDLVKIFSEPPGGDIK